MKEIIIAKRYARALIALAKNKNSIEAIGEEMALFIHNTENNNTLLTTLTNTAHDLTSRLNIITQIAEKLGISELTTRFLKVLTEKGRLEIITNILEAYTNLAHKEMNYSEMIVTSATKLSDPQYTELTAHFTNKTKKKIILRKKINPAVLGGVIVQMGDQVYDYSLKRQLNELKERMTN